MKLGFLLCSPEISGGTNVILEHGSGLQDLGHDIRIITENLVAPERYSWHPKAGQLHWLTFEAARQMSFDCLVATWWQSPYLLHLFEAKQYVYFIQSIESRFFKPDDPTNMDLRDHSIGAARCDHSYYFSLPIITEAAWIKEYLEKNCNQQPFLVRNGISKEFYRDDSVIQEKPQDGLRVLIEGPVDVFHKNVPRTIELCREAGVKEVWLLSSSEVKEIDGVDRVFSRVPLDQTPPIYRSCDLLVKLSYVEGMFGPPLEMFHCGGTAIVYDVTGHDEYIVHDVNGLVATRGEEQQVVSYLQKLNEDRVYLNRLCDGAKRTADSWQDWQDSTKSFEDALDVIMVQTPTSRQYLENISGIFNSYEALQLDSRELSRHGDREAGSLADEQHNFIQAYTYSGEQIIDETWCHYHSGSLVTRTCELAVQSNDCQIRLDPSVRIGVIHIYGITLKTRHGDELACFSPVSFERLCVTGSARWLSRQENSWVIHSFGNDPQIILPALDYRQQEIVHVDITLREFAVGQYIAELEAHKKSGTKGRKLLGSLRGFLDS